MVDLPPTGEAEARGVTARFVGARPDGTRLAEVGALLERGELRCPEVAELPLERAIDAQALSESGHARGKIVLKLR